VNAQASTPRSRVIVAVGPNAFDPTALAAAARLARAGGTELTALFVEDINLLRLAELPFAYDVSATSGTSRRFAASDIERELRSQAEELRSRLFEVAENLHLDLKFEIARGRPISVMLDAFGQQDMVVLASPAARTLVHASPPAIMRSALRSARSRGLAHRRQPITAVLHSAATAPAVIAAAGRLARVVDTELIVVMAEQGTPDAGLAAMVGAWAGRQDAITSVRALPDLTPDSIAGIIANNGSHAVFWPGDEQLETVAEVEALLDAIACPLVLVR
jgi:hypothetical protein